MAYIYKITNDINDKVYVGKTEFSITNRFQEHCQERKRERSQHRPLYKAMNKYGIEHFKIELIEETDNPEEREKFWIEMLNSYHIGYNATLGGDGTRSIDYEQVITVFNKTLNAAETARELNISVDSVYDILNLYEIPRKTSAEVSADKLSIKTDMYDLNHNYIRSFKSMSEAARYIIQNNYSKAQEKSVQQHISEVCRGKRKTAYGFIWIHCGEVVE